MSCNDTRLLRSRSFHPAAGAGALALALAGGAIACVEPADDRDLGTTADELLGGVATDARPEIGMYGGCTATLIAPQWVLTAAHCVGNSNADRLGDRFTVTRGLDGGSHGFEVDRIHIFGAFAAAGPTTSIIFEYTPDGTGTNDVALLRLAAAVPAAVAVPATLASGPPADGTTVTVFGYGCQNRGTGGGGGFKQAVTYAYPSSDVLCPGDSGGPVVIGQATGSGAVFQVNVGFRWVISSWDVHGVATYFRDHIMSVIRTAGSTAVEPGFDRPGSDYAAFATATANVCQQACRDDRACRAFTYTPAGTCFLKSAAPDWVARPGHTSGLSPQAESNVNRAGADLANVNLGTQPPEACLAQCAGTAACAAYTYVPAAGSAGAQCWLKSAVPGTSTMVGVTSGVRRGLEPATNRAGFDYRDFDVANDPNVCAARCATETSCRAFTFTAPGVAGRPSARCFLKWAVPPPGALTGATSGVKRGLEQERNRPGGDYDHFDLAYAVPEDCQSACARDSRCKAFTYVPPGFNGASQPNPQCWLKSSVPWPTAANGLVSGVRGADFF